jgi:outer membrane receptor for ferric coprogen and ferric-rhodotorulic acid
VINMVLKRPTDAFKGSVTARYGSWDRHYLEADMGGALNDEGSLRGRVVVANADIKNQVDYNNNDNGTYYGTLEFDLSDRTRLSVYALHQTKDILPTNGLPAYKDGSLLDIGRSTYLGSAEDFFDADTTDVGASLQHAFANGGVGQVSARYMDHDMRLEQTFTNGPVDAAGNTGLMFNGQEPAEEHGLRCQLQSDVRSVGAQERVCAGLDYKRYESDIQTYTNRNLGKIMCSISTRPGSPSRTTATPRMTMRSSRSSVCMAK